MIDVRDAMIVIYFFERNSYYKYKFNIILNL